MLTRKDRPKYQSLLERKLERAIDRLDPLDTPEQYAKNLALIERMHAVLGNDKPTRISPETRATIAANLAGILLILNHERVNLISRNALSFVIKTRMT